MTPLLVLQGHYLTGCFRLKLSLKCLLIDLDTRLSSRNIHVLLMEAKTQFGIQKRKVRVCRIMKIAVNKARCLSKNLCEFNACKPNF